MRKGIFGTFGTAALAALVNATPVDAQTPKHTAPTEAQHNTHEDIAKEVQSAGLHKLMKRIESAPQILPVVISYLNSRKSFEYHELTSLQYTFFPQLAKQPARVPSAVPLLRTYMHSVLAGDYTPESLFPGFGTVLTILYKTERPAYRAIAQELLESRASDEDVLRSIFSRYSRELAFVDLDTETRSKLLPGLLKRLGTIESESVIAEYAKESTEQRTSHQFVNILDENIRLKVLESVSDSLNGDQLDSLSSEIIATAHRWATTPMLKQHLVRICRLNAFAVFKNIAMLKNIPDIDILSLIQQLAT